MGGENLSDYLHCRQGYGVRSVTLQLLACCYLTQGKGKITPLNSASSGRTLILWVLRQLDTWETVPVEEWEESKGNRSDAAEWRYLLNPKGRIYIINCLILRDSSTSETCGWEWVLLVHCVNLTAVYIALPPCNLPRYQLDASKAKRGKKSKLCYLKPAQVLQCFYQNSAIVSRDVAIPARSGKIQPLVLATCSNFS